LPPSLSRPTSPSPVAKPALIPLPPSPIGDGRRGALPLSRPSSPYPFSHQGWEKGGSPSPVAKPTGEGVKGVRAEADGRGGQGVRAEADGRGGQGVRAEADGRGPGGEGITS